MIDSSVCVSNERTPQREASGGHVYRVYGFALHSEVPLPLPVPNGEGVELARIELRTAAAAFFSDALGDISLQQLDGSFYELGRLKDGSIYARWRKVGEFLVSANGARIFCRPFDESTTESFQVYLLGQALSFAMVKCGFEPFHGTVVVVDGTAVPLLGASGFGKSSLAACFLEAGYRLLTDDVVILQPNGHRVFAYPGPPRIKLFPHAARRFLGDAAAGVRMNPQTHKLVLPLNAAQSCVEEVPANAIYILNGCGPREADENREMRIGVLSPREAFVDLLSNTFNMRIRSADRLQRQIHHASQLANVLPVKKLFYSRDWAQLSRLRDAIISDSTSNRRGAPE
jgi:hypothetical protein